MKVLLVEDSFGLQSTIVRGLRHSGYAVDACGNGAVGLRRALRLLTNRDLLEITLRNLLENAVEYAPEKSRVDVIACSEAGGVSLQLVNDAGSLGDKDLSQMFVPFWRPDEARTDPRHQGLGLSVVKALSARMGMSVEARFDSPGRITFEIVSPARVTREAVGA